MKTKIIVLFVGIIFVSVQNAYPLLDDIEFYHDAVINDGEVYGKVSVYDTEPNYTTVDMLGGSVRNFRTYDSSIGNIYGGEVWAGFATYNSSTVNIYDGNVAEHLNINDSSVLNIYGGNVNIGNSPVFDELSTVNIYGYGFNYDPGLLILTGFLSDGSSFIFSELSTSDYAHLNLIPEPATLLFFALGGLFLRRRN